MAKIKSIKAREILDSKGNPTVEVDLITEQGLFQSSVPSGVSTGKHEALELRDGGKRYNGMGVLKAVKNVNEIIGPKLIGKDPTKQKEIDELMIELDGTENKSKLGANAILAVSIAVCRAGAWAKNVFLYQHIAKLQCDIFSAIAKKVLLPAPCFLVIEGGLHAGNDLDVQEFMIAPEGKNFSEQLNAGTEIYHILKQILRKKFGESAINIGLEGGFASPLKKTEQVLDLIVKAIDKAGYKNKARIILDVAASIFYKSGKYKFERKNLNADKMIEFYLDLIKRYPILGIEDPLAQEDWDSWRKLHSAFHIPHSASFIIGDDLTVTNKKRIKKAIQENCLNGIIIKPNQIGTLSETIEAAKLGQNAGLEIFVKHRAGETNDDFIADLAVGLGAKYIMAGAPCRGERVAKYNRLLRIEQELK